ncbi:MULTISPECIES: SMI1/KNR4 family protein [unclassified Pseudoalteromonas]|uniref:SMI1/KNR4 family protein n=1 Tax=unclassified Pseudoalteromonas TaxID=194690 RepID=UPI0025B59FF8|nr:MULTISPECIES: SMI1/KNR4 family protein [unclassified Pseudoalteromonas]MDN3380439.1 SMI1/KNR4 family protein [Pseudoalteromonas sp. APC 3893]MDN3388821.1 SMI1/KNR4 family protein [Pseudoalteromonas sp. APC 4017]
MNKYSELIKQLDLSEHETFWQGSADLKEIALLEQLISIKLPPSLVGFLKECGGGGTIDAEVSGIEDNNATLKRGGTILGDTLDCRETFELPPHLIVIFYKENEICWCLDSNTQEKEYPMVNYNLFKKQVDGVIADSFLSFFCEYVELRIS